MWLKLLGSLDRSKSTFWSRQERSSIIRIQDKLIIITSKTLKGNHEN